MGGREDYRCIVAQVRTWPVRFANDSADLIELLAYIRAWISEAAAITWGM